MYKSFTNNQTRKSHQFMFGKRAETRLWKTAFDELWLLVELL